MNRINHLAVVASVVAHQVLGFVWYGLLFNSVWLAGLSKTPAEVDRRNPLPYIVDIAGWLLASYVIAWLIIKTNANSAGKGAALGAILWLGVAVPTLAPHYAFAGIKPIVTVIDAANVLIACLISGAILGGWSKRTAIPTV